MGDVTSIFGTEETGDGMTYELDGEHLPLPQDVHNRWLAFSINYEIGCVVHIYPVLEEERHQHAIGPCEDTGALVKSYCDCNPTYDTNSAGEVMIIHNSKIIE